MFHYLVRRLLWAVPIVLGLTLILFFLSRVVPGDPVATALGPSATEEAVTRLKESWGLDEPLYRQYFSYVVGLLHGDLGFSVYTGRAVEDDLARYFMATFELSSYSLIVAVLFGIPSGIITALKRNSWLDHLVRPLTMFGLSMPSFWVGILFLLVFYSWWGIAPVGGRLGYFVSAPPGLTGLYTLDSLLTGNWAALGNALLHLLGPALCLSLYPLAIISRQTRASMLEVAGEDYVRTARAKGLTERSVNLKHALKNGLLPIVTIVGIQYGYLLSRSVVVEVVFSWPGIGRYAVEAIKRFDLQPVLGFTILVTLIYLLVNLIVDLLYFYINPKLRYGSKEVV